MTAWGANRTRKPTKRGRVYTAVYTAIFGPISRLRTPCPVSMLDGDLKTGASAPLAVGSVPSAVAIAYWTSLQQPLEIALRLLCRSSSVSATGDFGYTGRHEGRCSHCQVIGCACAHRCSGQDERSESFLRVWR